MPIKFNEWTSKVEWKQTHIYKYFSETSFVFIIFQQYSHGKNRDDIVLKGYKLWKMNNFDINFGLKEVWNEVSSIIDEDRLKLIKIRQSNGKTIIRNNLPGNNFNYLGHLRPGGKNGDDKEILSTGQEIVKQRFWLNKSYIKSIIE
ncbi:hypothetical protein [Macrococcus lamae]|uniref:Restriction endonuclease n=1 Tax=Macrococcus lamae TaxID=198484 RepID=A0A4R6BTG2_9STAP|nr:hypothetical protein [Macrococcus lamae]TDM07716.1 hypothetical protein ERX29_08210 [Macrococcus lamae]